MRRQTMPVFSFLKWPFEYKITISELYNYAITTAWPTSCRLQQSRPPDLNLFDAIAFLIDRLMLEAPNIDASFGHLWPNDK